MADGVPGGLDFNTRVTREHRANAAINAAVDAGLTAKRATEPARQYLGASAIGDPCERRAQFEYAGAPRDPGKDHPGKLLRIFERGHRFEDMAAGWLTDAGFKLSRVNPRDGYPYGFIQANGRFRGHVDGVILGGPDIPGGGYPCLWEAKALNAKTYRAIERHGLAKEKPLYADQVAIYQAYLELTEYPCIFTITNADTCEQLHLLIPFDPERAQAASDRAVRIITATEAGDLLPRPFPSSDFFECRWCAFAQRCWSLPVGVSPTVGLTRSRAAA